MIDNLFIVESPLQALVAVELSLQFEGQENGIIYRLSGKSRQRNDDQILRVIDLGDWSFRESVKFVGAERVMWHISARKYITQLKKQYRGNVRNLFFGEFRSQWMHFARLAIAPEKFVLMDDGAAILSAKKRYIDQGIFYPKQLWKSRNPIKKAVKDTIYCGIFDRPQAQKPVTIASAFLREESEFKVDFSSLRRKMARFSAPEAITPRKAYFFGSKYSEAGILSLAYELDFISNVLKYYKGKGLGLVYCAHRDESEEKLYMIRDLYNVELIRPDLPAELYVLEHASRISEIGAAYSSVINNLGLIFPDKLITSFRFNDAEVNPDNRAQINDAYRFFEKGGVFIKVF